MIKIKDIECICCSTDAERNLFTTNIFSDYVNPTHPKDERDNYLREIPKSVVIIEAVMFDKHMNGAHIH